MKKYIVTERYYDNGRVEAWADVWQGESFEKYESAKFCDIYRTVAETKDDAKQMVDDALNA